MCWSAAGSSVRACVCLASWVPAAVCSPGRGRKDTDPGCSCRCGVPRGEKRGKWRSRQASGHPSTDAALCCFGGGQWAWSWPGGPSAAPQSPPCGLDPHQEGWRPAPGSVSQSRCCKASAVGGLHVSTGLDLAQPMPSTLLWPLHALRGSCSPSPANAAVAEQPCSQCGFPRT